MMQNGGNSAKINEILPKTSSIWGENVENFTRRGIPVLDNFQRVGLAQNIPNLGYTVIFLLAVVNFILGTIFVRQIKKVR